MIEDNYGIVDTRIQRIYSLLMETNKRNISSIIEDGLFENDQEKVKAILSVYVDPDDQIQSFDHNGMRMSLDGYCGLKTIIRLFSDCITEIPSILYDIRRTCFVWPVHKIPTFNTYRRQTFGDRVDYTLFAIKCYLDTKGEECLFDYVIKNSKSDNSRKWIDSFDNSFTGFVDEMGYKHLVDKDVNGKYYIKDYITGEPIVSLDTIKTVNKIYIKELQKRINNNSEYNFY